MLTMKCLYHLIKLQCGILNKGIGLFIVWYFVHSLVHKKSQNAEYKLRGSRNKWVEYMTSALRQ